jgi:hypothetical protein
MSNSAQFARKVIINFTDSVAANSGGGTFVLGSGQTATVANGGLFATTNPAGVYVPSTAFTTLTPGQLAVVDVDGTRAMRGTTITNTVAIVAPFTGATLAGNPTKVSFHEYTETNGRQTFQNIATMPTKGVIYKKTLTKAEQPYAVQLSIAPTTISAGNTFEISVQLRNSSSDRFVFKKTFTYVSPANGTTSLSAFTSLAQLINDTFTVEYSGVKPLFARAVLVGGQDTLQIIATQKHPDYIFHVGNDRLIFDVALHGSYVAASNIFYETVNPAFAAGTVAQTVGALTGGFVYSKADGTYTGGTYVPDAFPDYGQGLWKQAAEDYQMHRGTVGVLTYDKVNLRLMWEPIKLVPQTTTFTQHSFTWDSEDNFAKTTNRSAITRQNLTIYTTSGLTNMNLFLEGLGTIVSR